MSYPNAIKKLEQQLTEAPASLITTLAGRIIEGAKAYDNFRVRKVIDDYDYPGGIKRNFTAAVEHTADHVFGAPWADSPDAPLKVGEVWNKGRRASLTGQKYGLDAKGLPINPYLNTGIKERGVIGLYGPNHAVDVGLLTVKKDNEGKLSLYAYGIMKGKKPAFCGGFAEYTDKDENGFVIGRDIWLLNQAREFFEEMVSGSIKLVEPFAGSLEKEYQRAIASRVESRGGKPLSEHQVKEIGAQIETQLKLRQVQEQDPGFLQRLNEIFQESQECYSGPVRSSNRNTDTAWVETYLSWVRMDDEKWDYICGENPVFDYQLSAGDDADDVVAHRIDENLLKSANGTHSAMFLFMAASYLLDSQKRGLKLDPSVLQQLEGVANFVHSFGPKKFNEPVALRAYPIIWVIGATRSSKTALATAISDQGPASLGFHLIQTGNYFRQRYGEPDTYSREFVFNISAFASRCLEEQPDCHEQHLASVIAHVNKPCVIEGERNPREFAKLYDPKLDMVFFLNRLDVEKYSTTIERGVSVIEDQVRWFVANGIAPQESVIKMTFGNGEVKAEYFGTEHKPDHVIIQGAVKNKKDTGTSEERYPWISILIGLVREKVMEYYCIKEYLTPATIPPKLGN